MAPKNRPVGTAHDAELGGEHDFVAARLHDLCQQPLVGAHAVDIGGIEEVDADIERGIEHTQIRDFIGRSVEVRHAHAAEADRRDFQALRAKFATRNFHGVSQGCVALMLDNDAIGRLEHYCRVLA